MYEIEEIDITTNSDARFKNKTVANVPIETITAEMGQILMNFRNNLQKHLNMSREISMPTEDNSENHVQRKQQQNIKGKPQSAPSGASRSRNNKSERSPIGKNSKISSKRLYNKNMTYTSTRSSGNVPLKTKLSVPKNLKRDQQKGNINQIKTAIAEKYANQNNQNLPNKIESPMTVKQINLSPSKDKPSPQSSKIIYPTRKRSPSFKPSPTSSVTKSVSGQSPNGSGTLVAAKSDRLVGLKQMVTRAVHEGKTFTICGNYPALRRAFVNRGWVEKMRVTVNAPAILRKLNSQSVYELTEQLTNHEIGEQCKRLIISKLLGHSHQVDFYWDYFNDAFKVNSDKVKMTIINRLKMGIYSYTTKQGLCDAIKIAHWYNKPGTTNLKHPRSYKLMNNGDPKEFIDDFNLTAATALLKWVVNPQERGKSKLVSEYGKIPLSAFHFAADECMNEVRKMEHKDIDYEIKSASETEWNNFLENYYKIVHLGHHFKQNARETEYSITGKAKYVVEKMQKHFPNMKMDGYMNIWILKPVRGSQGHGIHICRTLQYILKVIKANTNRRYVIQKYIEKPLLIFNTKFDIRQWFLISCTNPLTIWIYRECYLRFSSQTYNLRKLHESIHLTNNSVQCRYNIASRDIALPNYNMWDSRQFRTYLTNIGFPYAFSKIIYPGMKECILAAILMNQENLDRRPNSFELYGADFMLTEDFQPWLIEINWKPALYASTPVTAKMCPQVLEDMVKVIIDLRKNSSAKTGEFELLYKGKTEIPKAQELNFRLQGKPINPQYFCTPEQPQKVSPKVSKKSMPSDETLKLNSNLTEYMARASGELRTVLERLLDLVEKKRQKRRRNKNARKQSAPVVSTKSVDLSYESFGSAQSCSSTKIRPHSKQTRKRSEISEASFDSAKEKSIQSITSTKGVLEHFLSTAKSESIYKNMTLDRNSGIEELYVNANKSGTVSEQNSDVLVKALRALKTSEDMRTEAMKDVIKMLCKVKLESSVS